MEYKVSFHKIDDDDYDKYNGYIEVKIFFHYHKINWVISDCSCYPSSEWLELLNYMKGITTSDKSPKVGGGGNSYWYAKANKSSFKLYFDISGCGGNSTIIHEFDIDKMIPVVEEIIEKIKKME